MKKLIAVFQLNKIKSLRKLNNPLCKFKKNKKVIISIAQKNKSNSRNNNNNKNR